MPVQTRRNRDIRPVARHAKIAQTTRKKRKNVKRVGRTKSYKVTDFSGKVTVDMIKDVDRIDCNKRMLMRDWLIKQVEKGQIRGLKWRDSEKTLLEIPWLHGSRHGWQEEDCELFKRWALHTGKYEDCDTNSSKKWKANFRCAINSLPDVEEVTEMTQKKGVNAYRVYRFLPAKPKRSQCKRISRKRCLPLGNVIKCQLSLPRSPNNNVQSNSTNDAFSVTKKSLLKDVSRSITKEDLRRDTSMMKNQLIPTRHANIYAGEGIRDDPADHSYAHSSIHSPPANPKGDCSKINVMDENRKSLHQTGGHMYENNTAEVTAQLFIDNNSNHKMDCLAIPDLLQCECGPTAGTSTSLNDHDREITKMVDEWLTDGSSQQSMVDNNILEVSEIPSLEYIDSADPLYRRDLAQPCNLDIDGTSLVASTNGLLMLT